MAEFSLIATRVAHNLRQEGPLWLCRRLRREVKAPTTRLGKVLLRWRLGLRAWLKPAAVAGSGRPGGILYAYYDLQVSPVTFDAIWFAVGAELARNDAGAIGIHFVVVPGWEAGLRVEEPDYEAVVDRAARHARILNILLPLFDLLPATVAMTVASSRDEAARTCLPGAPVFPRLYDPRFAMTHGSEDVLERVRRGNTIAVLRAPEPARRHIRRWIESHTQERRLIVISLRNYGYMPARNSNLKAWARFAAGLDPMKFAVVIIPDVDQTMTSLPTELARFMVVPEAAWNIGLRMAFYEAAYLNLSINSGPALLSFLNPRVRSLMFGLLNPAVPQTTEVAMRERGFVLNEDPPFFTPFQHWVWDADDYEVIEREFRTMVANIEADPCRLIPAARSPSASP